ncbi:MAG: Uma2 family endonuclease [Bacteroidota bacterium]
MSIKLKRKLFSISEYHQLAKAGMLHESEKVELLGGEIIYMSPIGSHHVACVNRLNHFLQKKLGDQFIISVQNPLSLPPFSEPEPDLAILTYRPDFYAKKLAGQEDIHLVIEVSDTTLEKDVTVKGPIYARAQIPEYWVIDLAKGGVIVKTHPQNGVFQITQSFQKGEPIHSSTLAISLAWEEIFGE